MNQNIRRFKILFICSILASVTLPFGLILAETPEKIGVKIMEKEIIGKFLADGNGMTLYHFTRDEKNSSSCIEGCALNWPPFYNNLSAVGEGLAPTDFAVITRADARKQTTYKGMPLYYFKNDKYPGDTFGQGIGDVWFLINPQ